MIRKIVIGDTVGTADYQVAYDRVAPTYEQWVQVMGQYTDRIISPSLISSDGKPKILDLACGTGYITNRLLGHYGEACSITAVDQSKAMLDMMGCASFPNLTKVQSDGTRFLDENMALFDAIYCGWALPYLEPQSFPLTCAHSLRHGGHVGVIANCQGTLKGLERIFLKVMKNHPDNVLRPMSIRFNLLKHQGHLEKLFVKQGYVTEVLGSGDQVMTFSQPEMLLDWVMDTGALAGCREIFYDFDVVKPALIDEIKVNLYEDGVYKVNHRFVYGVFRLL